MLSLIPLLCASQMLGVSAAPFRMASVFGSQMVLQRDSPATFWGWSTPSTNVTGVLVNLYTNETLTVNSMSSATDGLWSMTFPPQPASGFLWKFLAVTSNVDVMRCLEYQFYCSGASLTLYPLAFGDVIECIGQSNSASARAFFQPSPLLLSPHPYTLYLFNNNNNNNNHNKQCK